MMSQHTSTQKDDEARLDAAWLWLCDSRKTAPDNADIWDLRFQWATRKPQLLQALQTGTYQLKPMQMVGKNRQVMWSAENALALKWCALALEQTLPLHSHCEHIKGHGGGKASIQKRHDDITQHGYRWVCRTDIKGYYQHINKATLLSQLKQHVTRTAYLNLLTQYVHYSVEDGGEFYTPESGIARGCALSPLMGAFHLWTLDNHFASQKKIAYARYMDDFIILAKTRWSLRKQVKRLNQFFNEYGFEQHPDKTQIGRVEKGFDWLGGQFGVNGVEGVSPRSIANHLERLRQLYERTRHWATERRQARVAGYRKRWKKWTFELYLVALLTPGYVFGYNLSLSPRDVYLGLTPSPGSWGTNVVNSWRNAGDIYCIKLGTIMGKAPDCVNAFGNNVSMTNGGFAMSNMPITNSTHVIPAGSYWLTTAAGGGYIYVYGEEFHTFIRATGNACNNYAYRSGGSKWMAMSTFIGTSAWCNSVYQEWTSSLTFMNGAMLKFQIVQLHGYIALMGPVEANVRLKNLVVVVDGAVGPGTYQIPGLYAQTSDGYSEIISPGVVKVAQNCTVAPPSASTTINFGQVAAGAPVGTALSQRAYPLRVTCNTSMPDAGTVEFGMRTTTGNTPDWKYAHLKTGSIVAGLIGASHSASDNVCGGVGNMLWHGGPRAMSKSGSYNWIGTVYFTLCGNGSTTTGGGTATGTIQYTWK